MKKINKHFGIAKPWVKPRAKYTRDCRAAINGIAARNDRMGFTLIEMMVVIGIVALLAVFGIPAVRVLVNSFHADGNTRMMINSALSAARAIAASEQTYAGVRFQYAYNPDNPDDILDMPQYMILIVNEDPANMGNLTIGYRAVEGMEPIKLPDMVGVMDLKVRTSPQANKNDENTVTDGLINDPAGLRNATTFSIIFSPAGKIIVHDVRTRNKNGTTADTSQDDIFNTQINVENNNDRGMFYQDDYPLLGLGQELSRNSFIIYDTNILKRTEPTNRWNSYLQTLPAVHMNSYTGGIINNK